MKNLSNSCVPLTRFFFVLTAVSSRVCTALRVPSVFSDNVVLQTNAQYGTRAFLNGYSEPGERITINLSGSDSGSYVVFADNDGEWGVMLNPHGPSTKPFTITISGEHNEHITIANATFGDVFLCAGDGDMADEMNSIVNASNEIADASNFPQIYLFASTSAGSPTQQENITGQWVPASPKNVQSFSALCYLTARNIASRGFTTGDTRVSFADRPIGLVLVADRDASIAAWVPPTVALHCAANREEPLSKDIRVQELEGPRGSSHHDAETSQLWNGLIYPLKSLSIRGVLFSHGTADVFLNTTNCRLHVFETPVGVRQSNVFALWCCSNIHCLTNRWVLLCGTYSSMERSYANGRLWIQLCAAGIGIWWDFRKCAELWARLRSLW
eukprot:m.300894 g.300894  ORF g.300894 m.300894 type:complete len:385 (-) comp20133_c0_seq2:783-1937(-)